MGTKHALSFVLILIVSLSSLTMLEHVFAQSTKPSPPEFTIQMPNESTIQLVVKNQAFTKSESVNAIEYKYRVKNHETEIWVRHGGDGELQSESNTTIITIKTPYTSGYPFSEGVKQLVNGSVLDFQVQAATGYYLQRYVEGQMPGAPLPTDGYWETSFNISETSEWSNTQTINMSSVFTPSITNPEPTPTNSQIQNPTASPNTNPTSTPGILTPTNAPLDRSENIANTINNLEIVSVVVVALVIAFSVTLLLKLRKGAIIKNQIEPS